MCVLLQGTAVVLQRKTEDGQYIEVGHLGQSDYFGTCSTPLRNDDDDDLCVCFR